MNPATTISRDEANLSGPLRDAIEQVRRQAPSADMLARVLQRARQIPASAQNDPTPSSPDTTLPAPRRNPMFTFAARGLAAAVAASALIGAWLYNQVSSTEAADLGAVLTRTSAAKSLELKVTQAGKTGEVWVHGQELRRELPDGKYQIARDGKAWLVDEKANRASVQSSAVFGGPDGKLDLLALLNLPADFIGGKQKQLLAAQPAERVTRDGLEIEIYRWQSVGPRARSRSRPRSTPRPSCFARSKACGFAASGSSRSAAWRSSPATSRLTKSCSW